MGIKHIELKTKVQNIFRTINNKVKENLLRSIDIDETIEFQSYYILSSHRYKLVPISFKIPNIRKIF